MRVPLGALKPARKRGQRKEKATRDLGVLCGILSEDCFLAALWFTWRDLAVSVRDDGLCQLVDAFAETERLVQMAADGLQR